MPAITVQTVAPVVSATALAASVTVSSGATDPDTSDNSANTETAFPQTGIQVTAEDGLTTTEAGGTATFTVVLTSDASEGTFYTLTPCRLLDTRTPEGGPALDSGTPVILHLHGACGIPETARAVAVNVTVLEPKAPGRLILYPGNEEVPSSSILPFRARVTRANQALLGLSTDGTGILAILPLLLSPEKEWVHVILDVTGYFE